MENTDTTPATPEVPAALTEDQAAQELLARWNSKDKRPDAEPAAKDAEAADEATEETEGEQSDEDEASAKLWIARMIEWRRLQSRQPDPQDADLCLPGESREPPHGGSRGSGDETRETK